MAIVHAFPVAAALLEHLGEFRDHAHGVPGKEVGERHLAGFVQQAFRAGADELRFLHAAVACLRGQVDLEDALELVAEEVEAHGQRAARREDVHHAAAHGEVAGILDGLGARVAGVGQPLGEFARRAGCARAHHAQDARQEIGAGHHLHEGRHRHHGDGGAAALGEAAHHGEAFGQQVERGTALARHGFERRKKRSVGRQARGGQVVDLRHRLLGLVGVRGDEEERAPRALRKRGRHEGGAASRGTTARRRPARLDVCDEWVKRARGHEPGEPGRRCIRSGGHQCAA